MRNVWVFTVWDSKKPYLLYGGVGEIFFLTGNIKQKNCIHFVQELVKKNSFYL